MSTSIPAEATGRSRSRRGKLGVDTTLTMPVDLGIEQVGALRKQLAPHLNSPRAVVIEAAEVQQIHSAAMQLFCLFCSDRRNAGREVVWSRPSPSLRSAAALLGVSTLLKIAHEGTEAAQ